MAIMERWDLWPEFLKFLKKNILKLMEEKNRVLAEIQELEDFKQNHSDEELDLEGQEKLLIVEKKIIDLKLTKIDLEKRINSLEEEIKKTEKARKEGEENTKELEKEIQYYYLK